MRLLTWAFQYKYCSSLKCHLGESSSFGRMHNDDEDTYDEDEGGTVVDYVN